MAKKNKFVKNIEKLKEKYTKVEKEDFLSEELKALTLESIENELIKLLIGETK